MSLKPEQSAVAKHRFDRAETTLNEARDELDRNNYRLTVNRAYHGVDFNALFYKYSYDMGIPD